jgi:hypothetical protein
VGISLGFHRERWTLLWDLTISGWPNEWINITWQCFIKSDSRYLYEYIIYSGAVLGSTQGFVLIVGPWWSCSYCSWTYNYICNQCLSPLTLWVWIPLSRGVLDTTLWDKVCQWNAAGRWFSPDTTVFSTDKTDRHDLTDILLKVAFNSIILNPNPNLISERFKYVVF